MNIYRIALNTRDLRRAGFDAAVALARRAGCYEMNLGTLEESCALLEDLVTADAPQAGTASREIRDCPPTTVRHEDAGGDAGTGVVEDPP